MKIGIFLPNWLGDVVMATPALRAIHRRYGADARLVGILRPHLAELLRGTSWLDETWFFDPRSPLRDQRRFALVRRMRRERLDMAILMTNSLHTAILARLGGARRRIGYDRDGRGWLLTGRIPPPRKGHHIVPMPVVDYYLDLAKALGCGPESRRLELAVTDEEQHLGEKIWRQLGLRNDGRVVAINSSGAFGAAKLWPLDQTAALARRIADQLDHDVLVICGPQECDAARETVRRAGHDRVFSLAQYTSIGATKAALWRSRLLVSTDSGPRHVAAAFGRPVITLFGPTRPIWVANPTVRGVDLQVQLPCSGCRQRTCPLGHHRCMEDLSVSTVHAEVTQIIEEEDLASAAA